MGVYEISRVVCELTVGSILDYRLTADKNAHAQVFLKAAIEREEMEKIGEKSLAGEKIVLWGRCDGGDEEVVLFQGIIRHLTCGYERHQLCVELECVSCTYLLDGIRRCRSFQNGEQTWKDIVRKTIQPQGSLMYLAQNTALDFPVIQYMETDWEFLIRAAGYCGTSVFAGFYGDRPQVYFGLPAGEEKEIRVLRYQWTFSENAEQFPEHTWPVTSSLENKSKYLIVKAETCDLLRWGDSVTFGAFHGRVAGMTCRMEKGVLIFGYTLCREGHIVTYRRGNGRIQGVTLTGRVLEVEGNKVKLHLDIDQRQDPAQAWPYPWVTGTGNGMYCMPEAGTQAALYIPSPWEREGICTHAVRTNGRTHPEMHNPANRYLTARWEKRLTMTAKTLLIDNRQQKKQASIGLYDHEKVTLKTAGTMEITAQETISLRARHIWVHAPAEITMLRKDVAAPAVVNLCNSFDVTGSYGEITASGTGRDTFPAIRQKPASHIPDAWKEMIAASTPVPGGVSEMEKYLAGTQMVRLYMDKGGADEKDS